MSTVGVCNYILLHKESYMIVLGSMANRLESRQVRFDGRTISSSLLKRWIFFHGNAKDIFGLKLK